MTIFKHKNGRLYKLYEVTPRRYATTYYESEDLFTHEKRKLNNSSWKKADFNAVSNR